MSFLDHIEELRGRLFRALGAVLVGCFAGWYLVERFGLVALLKAPIAPYLPDGKLVVLSPTEPLMIVLKLAIILGCILSSPIVIWEVWGFLSPALYARERRVVVPALFVGSVLFLTGAALSFIFVVPQALEVLFSFQTDSLATMITFEKYFDFVVQLMLAMGISFELPLVIIILASFGLVTPAGLNRFRRVAIVMALVAGSILSPGTDVFSMLMLSIPLILLYEVGFLGSVVVWRRKLRSAGSAAIVLALLFGGAGRTEAQVPSGPPAGRQRPAATDTTKPPPGQAVDSAAARRLGLPTGPKQQFPVNDSVLDALLRREGYEPTRFKADSATLYVQEKRIDLAGAAMTERTGSILEAEIIGYEESSCVLNARGDPKVFDNGTVLVGEGLRYNTCERRAVVSEALTNFQEGGVEWFMRGNLSQDSTAKRIYAATSEITSCDLPVPHYHFSARQSKWISKTVLVARPAVLYVRDVPMLWLPFIFQDARPGRRSGILVPQFGINDIIRFNSGYQRQVTNVGYYWAPSDYFDATGRFDWYAGRYYQWGVGTQYRWLDRFTTGSAGVNRQVQDDGAASLQIRWNHQQNFSLTSRLTLNLDFVNNTEVRSGNAVTPSLTTRQIVSSATYTKRFAWGSFDLGGNRRQSLTDGSITQQFPAVTFSPNPIDIGNNLTWSPSFSFRQDRQIDYAAGNTFVAIPGGGIDTLAGTFDSRTTTVGFGTPLRIGRFNWANAFSFTDQFTTQRQEQAVTVPDTTTAAPDDSITVRRIVDGDFQSTIDWTTQINLPQLLSGSWKVQPSLGVANVTSGPFMVRNARTAGGFVAQAKRPQIGLVSNPTFFGQFPGFGPLSRIRHSVLPSFSWSYTPAADIPEEYARAVARPGQPVVLKAIASQRASVGLLQTFEGKGRPAPGDTSLTPTLRKYRLLSISTSAMSYDFEQAKQEGRTGWVTPTLSNSFQTDLIPNFTFNLTHDLWEGQVGTDTARWDPHLTNVSASLSISGATFRGIGRLLGFGPDSAAPAADPAKGPERYVAQDMRDSRKSSFDRVNQAQRSGRTPFSAAFNFSLTRPRPVPSVETQDQISLGFSSSFSPTPFWGVQWRSNYNFVEGRFEDQQVILDRDLHEWRASFTFEKNSNGNFALYFAIALLDLPDIKFDYNQTTLEGQ
jgi:Tat protein translocase TatC